jgi:hypothetical protein
MADSPPAIDPQRVAQQVELSQAVDQAFRLGYQAGLRAAHAAILELSGAAADGHEADARDAHDDAPPGDESERLSMDEQRRIHSRALRQSGPPAGGETRAQRDFRLECEASIERDRAVAKSRGLTLTYEYPFD